MILNDFQSLGAEQQKALSPSGTEEGKEEESDGGRMRS